MINCCTKCLTSRLRNLVRSRRLLSRDILDPKNLEYTPIFKPGKFINSGTHARVYEVEDYPDLVIRIEGYTKKYCPFKLKKSEDPITGVVANNKNGVTVMKKLSGTPLHGTRWDASKTPNIYKYKETLKKISELPDSAFEKYIDDVARIRQNGYIFDHGNPNNLLIDYEKGEINICDLTELGLQGGTGNEVYYFDFYPFVDGVRLHRLMSLSAPKENREITKLVRTFFNRIQEIGKHKGINLNIEDNNDFIAQLYRGDRVFVDTFLKDKNMYNIAQKNITPDKMDPLEFILNNNKHIVQKVELKPRLAI